MSGRVEAVVFDWGGTLTPWHDIDAAESYQAYASAHGSADVGALQAADAAAWARGRAPDHRSATFEQIVREAGVDPSGSGHERGVAAFEEFWAPHTYADPDAIATLTALRERGIRVGVLSNTVWPRGFHDEVFARDGLLELIDGSVYSSEIDVVKPHPGAFSAALAALGGVSASRAVYVGDRLFEDVYGPQQIGMRAVLVPHSRPPASQLSATDAVPDGVAKRLLDVVALVDQWS